MIKRRRLTNRILSGSARIFRQEVRETASLLPPGAVKDELLRKARQADTAAHLDEWANSSGSAAAGLRKLDIFLVTPSGRVSPLRRPGAAIRSA